MFLNKIELILFILLLTLLGEASEMPSWVLKQPTSTPSEVYYVGSSEGASTYGEAIENASKAALEKAIRENFGVDAQLENKFFETTRSSSVTSSLSEKSKRVRIEGFETRDSFVENSENGWSAFVLFSYQKAEILAEKQRLKSMKPEDSEINFSEIGSNMSQAQGRLEIVSDPPGASVLIDGKETLSKTPIRLSGVLEIGKHSLTIDHPDFQSVTREIIISPGSLTTVNESLLPASGYLTLNSTLKGTVILIDGKTVGLTPIIKYKVPASRKIRIDCIHPDAYKTSSEVSVLRDEDRNIFLTQQLLPAQLQVSPLPANAFIFIDGKQMSKGWNSIDPGQHHIQVSLPGYRTQNKTIILHGGEKLIEPFTLMSLTEEERLRIESEENERDRMENRPWIFSMGLSFNNSTHQSYRPMNPLGLDFMLEKKIARFLGIKAAVSMMNQDEYPDVSYSDNPRTIDSTQYEISLPIYATQNFYFGPAATTIKTEVKCTGWSYSGSTCKGYSLGQKGSGFVVGYQYFGPRKDKGSLDVYYEYFNYSDSENYKGLSTGRIGFSFSVRY